MNDSRPDPSDDGVSSFEDAVEREADDGAGAAASERDVLFSRVVDRADGAADWRRLDAFAAADEPAVWRELADWLRTDAHLREELAAALPAAVLPVRELGPVFAAPAPAPLRQRALLTWSGWAAALVLACAFAARPARPLSREHGPASDLRPSGSLARSAGSPATVPASNLLGELPLVLVDSRPAPDGEGFDLTVMRRLLESRRVDELHELARDELGRAHPVPVDPARIREAQAF